MLESVPGNPDPVVEKLDYKGTSEPLPGGEEVRSQGGGVGMVGDGDGGMGCEEMNSGGGMTLSPIVQYKSPTPTKKLGPCYDETVRFVRDADANIYL